jgi:uncharacterized membrane protein YphA (DoxX/SURF4 family)
MFPRGLPGVALLLLRISVALSLMIQVEQHWLQLSGLQLTGYVASGMALTVGILTPIAALLAVLVYLWGPFNHSSNNESLLEFMLDSVALSLIGPGAYSLDSLRFGRRIVKVSSDSPNER